MGLEKPNVIDATGIEDGTGTVVLTLADSWDWSDERTHLIALQDKLNAYFEFIESGQVGDVYPNVVNLHVRIDIYGRFPLVPSAHELIKKAATLAAGLKTEVQWRHHPDSRNAGEL